MAGSASDDILFQADDLDDQATSAQPAKVGKEPLCCELCGQRPEEPSLG